MPSHLHSVGELPLQAPAPEPLFSPREESPSADCWPGALWTRLLTFGLVTLGFEAMLFFCVWWFAPEHRRHWLLFLPVTFATLWLFYEVGVSWFHLLRMKRPRHRPARAGVTVDVFTTAAPGEPYEMFERSLAALARMRYPHRTYLLDGSGDPRLPALAARLGVDCIDCSRVPGAKAGKVNYALARTTGELVLVMDPDHVAAPELLDRVVGHFEDEDVGFVQVVQAYHNQDASFIARAAAEQTYGFYGPVMMGQHGCGAAVVIGANCTFRRKALESIGGHAVHLIEDFVTSLRLHANGWRSVYVPEIVARGLVPEDLGAYFSQQLKWATGMFQALLHELPRLFLRLRGWQKVTYTLSALYYLGGAATAVSLILPALLLLTGAWAVEMPIVGYFLRLAPFLVTALVIHAWSQRWMRDPRERGLQWRGTLLKVGTWPVYVLALAYALAGVKVAYLPTRKRKSRVTFGWLVAPHLAVAAGSLLGVLLTLLSPLRASPGAQLMLAFAALVPLSMLPTVLAAFRTRSEKGS